MRSSVASKQRQFQQASDLSASLPESAATTGLGACRCLLCIPVTHPPLKGKKTDAPMRKMKTCSETALRNAKRHHYCITLHFVWTTIVPLNCRNAPVGFAFSVGSRWGTAFAVYSGTIVATRASSVAQIAGGLVRGRVLHVHVEHNTFGQHTERHGRRIVAAKVRQEVAGAGDREFVCPLAAGQGRTGHGLTSHGSTGFSSAGRLSRQRRELHRIARDQRRPRGHRRGPQIGRAHV